MIESTSNHYSQLLEIKSDAALGLEIKDNCKITTNILEIYPAAKSFDLPIRFCGMNFNYQIYDFNKTSLKVLNDPVMTLEIMKQTIEQINEEYLLNRMQHFKKLRTKLYLVLLIWILIMLTVIITLSIFVLPNHSVNLQVAIGLLLSISAIVCTGNIIICLYAYCMHGSHAETINILSKKLFPNINSKIPKVYFNNDQYIEYQWKFKYNTHNSSLGIICEKILINSQQNEEKCKVCLHEQTRNPVNMELYPFCTNCGASFLNPFISCNCIQDIEYKYNGVIPIENFYFCGKCGLRKNNNQQRGIFNQ